MTVRSSRTFLSIASLYVSYFLTDNVVIELTPVGSWHLAALSSLEYGEVPITLLSQVRRLFGNRRSSKKGNCLSD